MKLKLLITPQYTSVLLVYRFFFIVTSEQKRFLFYTYKVLIIKNEWNNDIQYTISQQTSNRYH